jgi:hypothetical protein
MDMPFAGLTGYLQEVLGIEVRITDFTLQQVLSIYLKDLYEYKQMDYNDQTFILMKSRKSENPEPGALKKQAESVQVLTGCRIIYVSDKMQSYERKRLISYGINFIIVKHQIYLPGLGIYLQEINKRGITRVKKFAPATQLVLLGVMINPDYCGRSVTEAARLTGYTPMTITNAYQEIVGAGLADTEVAGKERRLSYQFRGRELWEKAQQYLSTPVKQRLWMTGDLKQAKLVKAGITALSAYTSLADNNYLTYAIAGADLVKLKEHDYCREVPAPEPGAFSLEVWKYQPLLLTNTGSADRLSLYLSLVQDETDERTLTALDELLEGVKW